MKILICIDDYYNYSNGMSISTQRFVKAFREMGHEVRVLSSDSGGKTEYSVPVLKLPFFSELIENQNYHFAKPVKKIIDEAIEWADIIHIEDPFLLCLNAAKRAHFLGKPVTGTFHLYPENMTASVPELNTKFFNNLGMKLFMGTYKYCYSIQCPTVKVRRRLEAYKYKGRLFVASNGISEDFLKYEKGALNNKEDVFTVLSIGRYAQEKDQKTLIKAVSICKHQADIRLILAGRGPLEEELKSLCKDITRPPVFKYFSQDELKQVICKSDLYVHCASVEIEGMACMEAFSLGCVPVIAESALSSTATYAINENNSFPEGDFVTLANRIDYWFERRDKLSLASADYIKYAKKFSVEKSAERVIGELKKYQENPLEKHLKKSMPMEA